MAVKRAKGKITAPHKLAALVEERGFIHLPLTFHHAEQAGDLPMHHRDPFDRYLIAQAQAEGLVIITRDARIPLYGVRTLAA
ncbi:MAG: type II toxin-antitoxin system VapC family toxin [Gammaproteobacteria bacterium]|nr:type II toxin-antitoxin system VapC family toxin [Gammaproteobacteria bacterium]